MTSTSIFEKLGASFCGFQACRILISKDNSSTLPIKPILTVPLLLREVVPVENEEEALA